MAETPGTIEVKVTYGPQLRAVVRSALAHVKNKLIRAGIEDEAQSAALVIVIDEMDKWPYANDTKDTLAEWIYQRFGFIGGRSEVWEKLDQVDKDYWEHEADAVRRAVGRSGFKRPDTSIDPVAQLAEMERMEHENRAPTSQLSFDDDAPSLGNPIPNDDGSFTIYSSDVKLDGRPIPDQDIRIGKRVMPYDVKKAKCWCGSKIGPRTPSDNWGNGCLADITHKWDGDDRRAKF